MENRGILIPDVTLYNYMNGIFKTIKEDFEEETDKTKTLLYTLFNKSPKDIENVFEEFNYYEQSIEIFIKNQPSVYLGYNMEVSEMTSVHILLPNENGENLEIGAGENNFGYDFDEDEEGETTDFSEVFTQRFNTTYNLIITSKSSFEVILTYNLLKACFLALNAEMDLAGLMLSKTSGGDLQLDPKYVPPHVFHRSLMVNFQYENVIPSLFKKKLVKRFTVTNNQTNN